MGGFHSARRSANRCWTRSWRRWRRATRSSATRTTTSCTRQTWRPPATSSSPSLSSSCASPLAACGCSPLAALWLHVHVASQNWLSELEIFATLFAALIHDFEHTGTTNTFHINSSCAPLPSALQATYAYLRIVSLMVRELCWVPIERKYEYALNATLSIIISSSIRLKKC